MIGMSFPTPWTWHYHPHLADTRITEAATQLESSPLGNDYLLKLIR